MSVLFISVGWYGPFVLSAFGFHQLNMLSDTRLLELALIVYGVAVLSVLGLASATVRSRVISQQNKLFSFIIPIIVVLGYLVGMSLILSFLLGPPLDL